MRTKNKTVIEEDADILLAHHETQIEHLTHRVSDIDHKMDLLVTEVHKLTTAITAQASKPEFDFFKVLDATVKIGLLIGLVISAIIYVTNSNLAGQIEAFKASDTLIVERLAAYKDRLNFVERYLDDRTKGTLP